MPRSCEGGRRRHVSKKNLWFFSPKSPKSLKNRALRALRRVRVGHRNRESAAAAGEIENHAKITDSKVDFVSRKWLKKPPNNLKIG